MGSLISKVPDSNGNIKDVILNYKNLTDNNILQYNNTYLGDGNLSDPPPNRVLPYLDLANVSPD